MSEHGVGAGELPQLSNAFLLVEPSDRFAMMEDVGRGVRQLFYDVRAQPGHEHGVIDGLPLAYAGLRDGYSYERVGEIATRAKAQGIDPCTVLERYFDMSHTSVPVRDAHPDEGLNEYMDYMAEEGLRVPLPRDEGTILRSLEDADVPGTRFRSEFGAHDNAIVAMGKTRRARDPDIVAAGKTREYLESARRTIDGAMYQVMRWGNIPNMTNTFSLDRWQTPHISLAVEAFAAAYGDRSDEVLAHYAIPLQKICDSWMEGRAELVANTPPGTANAIGRQALLTTVDASGLQDIVYRNYSDVKPNRKTWRGVRLEAVHEDVDLLERMVKDLPEEEQDEAWATGAINIRAACEGTKDFQPSTQSEDGLTMETLRTIEAAPVMLQALLAHLFRTTASALRAKGDPRAQIYDDEATRIIGVLNRVGWRDTGEDEGHYADTLIKNGQHIDALDATMAYPLLIGGAVPYDRAVKSANSFMRRLARRYGFLISDATTKQQWDGSPDNPETGEEGENRGWMSTIMLATESFVMAAMEAKANGHDPEPLLQAAQVGLDAVEGFEEAFEWLRQIREKVSVVRPTQFVNGGEYGQTEAEVQKGFGMQIGAARQLQGRDFWREVNKPEESWRRLTFARLAGNLAVPVPV